MRYTLELISATLIAAIVAAFIHRYRRRRTVEEIIGELRPCNVLPKLEIGSAIVSWRKTTEGLMNGRTRTRYLFDTLHNARCILALTTKLKDAEKEDLRYITERVWCIIACLPLSCIEDIIRFAYRNLPVLSPILAASAYGELWLRAKAVLYEGRPELIRRLEEVS